MNMTKSLPYDFHEVSRCGYDCSDFGLLCLLHCSYLSLGCQLWCDARKNVCGTIIRDFKNIDKHEFNKGGIKATNA